MRMSRAFAVMLAAVLMAVASLAGAVAPASATTTKNTTITFEPQSSPTTGYGDYYGLYADVYEAGTTKQVFKGVLNVYRRPIGGTTWTPVKANATAYFIEGFQLEDSFEYYADYSGYTAKTAYEDNYVKSTSPVFTVNVTRGVKYIQKSAKKFCGQVGPLSAPYKNKPIYHYYKVGKSKKWKRGYTEHTNKKSQFCYKVSKSGKRKHVKTPKGPKLKASKTVYVKSGGMKKHVEIYNYTS